MGLAITKDKETLYCRIIGEIDHHNAVIIRDEIDFSIENADCEMVVLDLGDTNFMDSSGIGLIMGRLRRAEKHGMSLSLVHVGERVMKILKMSGLDKTLTIKEDVK